MPAIAGRDFEGYHEGCNPLTVFYLPEIPEKILFKPNMGLNICSKYHIFYSCLWRPHKRRLTGLKSKAL
jgi:hypothetical protein